MPARSPSVSAVTERQRSAASGVTSVSAAMASSVQNVPTSRNG